MTATLAGTRTRNVLIVGELGMSVASICRAENNFQAPSQGRNSRRQPRSSASDKTRNGGTKQNKKKRKGKRSSKV